MTTEGRALVVGLGIAGEAVARRLAERGWEVTAVEDRPSPASRAAAAAVGRLGVTVLEGVPVEPLVGAADVVVPSPGVPLGHPAIEAAVAAGTPVWSEFELAARWSSRPMVAVTGTDGKTTVTVLIEAMLRASGLRTIVAGNTEPPLVDVLDLDLDVLVVEASSFRLAFTETFRPAVAVWLNLAEDHLDWHGTMAHYRASKAKVWAYQRPGDVAVANAEDPAVLAEAPPGATTFGLAAGDWRVDGDRLLMPDGTLLVEAGELHRGLPHDRANALAAAAAALAAGATPDGVRAGLRAFRGLPHRVALVGEHAGVSYYDDSKATAPHAALAAIRGFESVVLLAGGRNKGLDLSALAAEAGRIRAVIALGEAADDVERAFLPTGVPVVRAPSMDAAVALARDEARPGDVVLLSPACASFDWYRNYGERGDDFARAVRTALDVA